MFTWRKLGLVFSPQSIPGRPWMQAFAQAPSSLLLDDVIRVYFSCRPEADATGQYVSYSSFVDLDREDPTRVVRVADRPILTLGATGTFDEFGTYPVSVIEDDDRLVAYYGGWTRCESVPFDVAIGCAVSTDGGETFERIGAGPVLGHSLDEPFVVGGPKIRRFDGRWHLFYIAGRKWKLAAGRPEPVYRIRLATSSDGVQWSRLNRDLVEPRIEEDEAQASPDVFFAGGRYHMFFCYRRSVDYRRKDGGYRIGYASSTDLVTWIRDDAQAGIDVSDRGWDQEMVSYPHVFEVDGRWYLAYLGNQVGRNGFGLAELVEGPLA
jgi:predicted GH43/DUF377 family glycosyl hydrolase